MTIIVYTTKNCPYCKNLKEFLEKKALRYREVDAGTPEIRRVLVRKAQGRKTVPQVFIGDLHVGGYDDLMQFEKSGQLDKLFSEQAV